MEDNDPSGYKSNLAKGTKAAHRLRTLDQPPFSPDLNPIDFSIWQAIEKKALANAPPGKESAVSFKARLRRIAMHLSREAVSQAVTSIRKRAEAIFQAGGNHISLD